MILVRIVSGVLGAIVMMVAIPLIVISLGLASLTDGETAELPAVFTSTDSRSVTFGEFDIEDQTSLRFGNRLDRVTLTVDGERSFIGVAPPAQVARFLSLEQRPTESSIWIASDVGLSPSIPVALDQGPWTVVVMNPDGSRGVDARITAVIPASPIRIASGATLGAGLMAAAAAAVLFVVAFRRPNQPTPTVQEPQPVKV